MEETTLWERRTDSEPRAELEAPVIDSIWSDALTSLPPLAPGDRRVHTVVIGAGLTGLSAAYHLLRQDPQREVVVLEAEGLGGGASSRSTGMLTPGVGQNLAGLIDRVGPEAAREMYQQSLSAVRYVEELTRREEVDCELEMSGQLIVAHGKSGRSRLGAQLRTLESLDLPCVALSDAELAERVRLHVPEPRKSERSLPAALRLPVAGSLNPGKLLTGLVGAIERRAGRVVGKARVVSISREHPVQVTLADGSHLLAERVILATNGYSSRLGVLKGRLLPLHLRLVVTKPLSSKALEQLGWSERDVVIDSRRIFDYFRLTRDNRILFGGGVPRYSWTGATEPAHDRRDVEVLVAKLQARFPLDSFPEIEGTWTGVIGYTLDATPMIGRLPDNPAVVVLGGWCGHGIALSISSGKWIAEWLDHDSPASELPWFRQRPPWVPTELGRWLGVRAGVWAMASLDRL